jgi:nucleoside-diphosphate-sugar epimerase
MEEPIPWERISAVEGDVTKPGCGVEGKVPPMDTVWHSAASLRFENRYEAEILETNVSGTRHVFELARAHGARRVNAISTAYVVGSYRGHALEVAAHAPNNSNHYERSKVLSERLAAEFPELQVVTFRPSIVVGHSRTHAATTFSGLYGFTRQLVQFRGIMERMNRGLLAARPLRFRANPDMGVNLIPVDRVAHEVVAIGLAEAARGIYHITNPSPPTVGHAIRVVANAVGLAEPEFVGPDDPLEWLDNEFDKRLDFYRSYIQGALSFDRARTDAALSHTTAPSMELPPVRELVAWYLPIVEAERAGLKEAR